MLAIAGNLALKPIETTQRTLVTPGQLYRLLDAEFRAQRPVACVCRMRMVVFRESCTPGAANWALEPGGRRCARCDPVMGHLAARFGQLYDIRHHAAG